MTAATEATPPARSGHGQRSQATSNLLGSVASSQQTSGGNMAQMRASQYPSPAIPGNPGAQSVSPNKRTPMSNRNPSFAANGSGVNAKKGSVLSTASPAGKGAPMSGGPLANQG